MYWPREQITHYKSPALTIDVFSIAAIFYEMLTGAWVRDGFTELLERCKHQGRQPSIADYLNVIVTNPIIPIHDRNPDIPKMLADVIDRALREEEIPHDNVKMRETLKKLRYPDAGVFRNALVDTFKTMGVPLSSSFKAQQQVHIPLQEVLTGERGELDRPAAGTVMYSVIQPTLQKEVALLVLDLEHSTQYVLDAGDTSFSQLIGSIYRRVNAHASSSDLIFLKCTGDGFLMVFTTIPAAFALAATFLEIPVHPNMHIRMALHWGTVKIGPEGDVLGAEVHRVCRVEGVKAEDQIDPMADTAPLPDSDRILVTREGLKQLAVSDQKKFRATGKFQLKGFNESCELWVYS
jgi:class 3 adenylate cyclase